VNLLDAGAELFRFLRSQAALQAPNLSATLFVFGSFIGLISLFLFHTEYLDNNPRAMTVFWISLVPSPIIISGASR